MKHVNRVIYAKKMCNLEERVAKLSETVGLMPSPCMVELGRLFPDMCKAASELVSETTKPYDSLEDAIAHASRACGIRRTKGIFKRETCYVVRDSDFTDEEREKVLSKLRYLYPTGYEAGLSKKLVNFLSKELRESGLLLNYDLRYNVDKSIFNIPVDYIEHSIDNGRIVSRMCEASVKMELWPRKHLFVAREDLTKQANRVVELFNADGWHADGTYPSIDTEYIRKLEQELTECELGIENLYTGEK